jgi:hypothetical protein
MPGRGSFYGNKIGINNFKQSRLQVFVGVFLSFGQLPNLKRVEASLAGRFSPSISLFQITKTTL